MPSPYILVETRGRVGIITMNRPEKMNAMNAEMSYARNEQMEAWNSDPKIGAMVLTGAGQAFCSGVDVRGWDEDIKAREAGQASPRAAQRAAAPSPTGRRESWTQFIMRSKPVICAINGPCIGAGMTITLPCDVRIASDRARFSMRFIRIGGIPELASTHILPHIVGINQALELMLTGKTIDAEEAGRVGLVNRVVPHEKLMEEAIRTAEEMAFNPTESLLAIKQLVWELLDEKDIALIHRREGEEWQKAAARPYFKEAVRAFLEKRQPDFHRFDR